MFISTSLPESSVESTVFVIGAVILLRRPAVFIGSFSHNEFRRRELWENRERTLPTKNRR